MAERRNQQPTDPNVEVLNQIISTMGQQNAMASRAPQRQQGFLGPDQEGPVDAVTDPTQDQLSAVLTGLASAANPNSRMPVVSGLVGGTNAFQNARERRFEQKQQLYDQQTEALQQRLDNLKTVSGVSGDIQDRDMDREQLGLSRRRQELRETEFETGLQEADVERYMNPDTGQVTEFKKDRFGNVMYEGKPVNPTEIGLVPYDRQLYQDTQERLQGLRGQARTAHEMKNLIFDEMFPAAVGRYDARKLAAQGLGLGQETEVLTKRAKELSGNMLVDDLERMGARPSDRDLQELKRIHLNPNDDPEVWQDKYLNRVLPTYYDALARTHGDKVARDKLKPLVEGIPKSRIYDGVDIKQGSITDQLMNPPPQEPTGGGPVINEDNTGGTTSGGYQWNVVPAEQGSGQGPQGRGR